MQKNVEIEELPLEQGIQEAEVTEEQYGKYKKIDIGFMIVLLLVSIYMLIYILLSDFYKTHTQDGLSAGLFPLISIVMVILASVAYLIIRWIAGPSFVGDEEVDHYFNNSWYAILLSIIGLLFINSVVHIGLIVSVFFFLNAMFFILGYRKFRGMLMITLSVCLIVWVVFVQFIGLYFPNALFF